MGRVDGADTYGGGGTYITLPENREIFQSHGMAIGVEFLSLTQVRARELTGIRTVNSGDQDTQQGIFGTSTKCRLASVLGNGHSNSQGSNRSRSPFDGSAYSRSSYLSSAHSSQSQ